MARGFYIEFRMYSLYEAPAELSSQQALYLRFVLISIIIARATKILSNKTLANVYSN